jgi:hypothetical protein
MPGSGCRGPNSRFSIIPPHTQRSKRKHQKQGTIGSISFSAKDAIGSHHNSGSQRFSAISLIIKINSKG